MRASRKVARLTAEPAAEFYAEVLDEFHRAGVPFLIGGTFALSYYVGWDRPTKDVDVFIRAADVDRALEHFAGAGFDTELAHPHWLGKIRRGEWFADVIFSSGNGVARVDDRWFVHAVDHSVFGVPVRLSPPEEMIWSKSFVQERERYDGADVIHLLYHRGPTLDWKRLLARFGQNWRVLYSFLVLYGFVYPAGRDRIPAWVTDELMTRLVMDVNTPENPLCNGTLLSREQYLPDVTLGRMADARLSPVGTMSAEELRLWTEAIGHSDH
jgi:hypothetical protein